MKHLAIIVLLFVSACAGDPGTRATSGLAIACDTYATLLEQLTIYKGQLSASVVARIDSANKLTDPACSVGSAMNPGAAINLVYSGIELLKAAKGSL